MSPRAAIPHSTRTLLLVLALAAHAGCNTVVPTTQPDGQPSEVPPSTRPESPSAQPEISPKPATPLSAGAIRLEVYEDFRGLYRARAKTEYAIVNGGFARVEEFADLEALKAFLRPQIDQIMRCRYPHLSEANTDATQRVLEERHTVAVVAYLHAVKHEHGPHADNDFHVMLGSSPTPGEGIFITAEASALSPDGAHRVRMAKARSELLSIIGPCQCNGRFVQVSPPIRVRVVGSLLFDGAHGIGSVGPSYAKPFSVWEIHPILSIDRFDH